LNPEISVASNESFVIETAPEDIMENLASRLVADFGLFDPTLDLSKF
jgi:S-DNA-T family DNA segregation ATPase FtsK/SpoIIIE